MVCLNGATDPQLSYFPMSSLSCKFYEDPVLSSRQCQTYIYRFAISKKLRAKGE